MIALVARRYRTLYSLILAIVCVSFAVHVKQAYSLTLIDHDGERHHFDEPFKRIISLYPAHTENLVEMGASETLIGISTSDNFPASILEKPRFSFRDTVEKFIAARPDCILIRPMIRNSASNLVRKLEEYGITVISLQPTSGPELYSYWNLLGMISGYRSEASQMSEKFRLRLMELSQKVNAVPLSSRPRVYFEAIHSRMKTFSPQAIAIFCLESAGGINVAADAVPRNNTNIASYGKEKILSHAQTIDIYLAQSGRMNRITVDDIVSESGFAAIKAVSNNRVYLIEENLVSRPTTRLIDGMWQINKLLFQTMIN